MVYSSAQNKYIRFCDTYAQLPVPANERTLLLFVAHLYECKLKISTVKTYLSGVRSLHILQGFSSPLDNCPRLQMALRAVERVSTAPVQKLPITVDMLKSVRRIMG